MTGSLDKNDLIRRIANGDSVGAILLWMLSPPERRSLAQCAAARSFDAELFNAQLGVGDVSLADLVERGLVEALDDEGRWHAVAEALRDDAWQFWWLDGAEARPEPLVDLARELGNYFDQGGRQIELLRQLVISDLTAAEGLFKSLFWSADEEFDLARCQDAVDALSDLGRARFLSAEVADYRDECQRRIWARSAWATDYLQTTDAHFQPRPKAQRALDRLMQATHAGSWLLQIYGDGGTGKTTLLRHFISQHCVRQWPLIACARLDGDALDPATILDHPWLLLVEAAAQLNRQLPQGPFYSLLNDFGSYRALLRRVPHDVVAAESTEPAAGAEELVTRAFCSALAGSSRVLIVLDTLDDIVEVGRSAPRRLSHLVELLRRVHESANEVRVVLAGREDLTKIPGVDLPSKRVSHCAIGTFTEDEARKYLHERRGITDKDKIAAIVRKCDGMPFILAGVADEVVNEPGLTAADIDAIAAPQQLVRFMNDRVLMRINDPIVAWSLRNSVVPPVLSFEFFRNVMLPVLRETGPDDNFIGDWARKPRHIRYKLPLSVPGPADVDAIERLWKGIVASASRSRWMSTETSAGQDLVIVHPKVRLVLRREMLNDRSSDGLHDRAIEHYLSLISSLADRDYPAEWIGWVKAVIFYRFQLDGIQAAAEWQSAMLHARRAERLDWVRELAEYVTGPDFEDVSENQVAGIWQVRYEGYVQLGLVIAQCAGRLPGPAAPGIVLWPDEAATALEQAQQVLDQAEVAGAKLERIAAQSDLAALLAVEDPARAVRPDLGQRSEAAPAVQTPVSYLATARAYARWRGSASKYDTADLAIAAYRRSREAYADDSEAVDFVNDEAGNWLLANDLPDRALQWSTESNSDRLRAQALLALGRPSSALALLEGLPEPWSLRDRRIAAEAQLTLRSPRLALRALGIDAGLVAEQFELEPVDQRIEYQLAAARTYGEIYEVDAGEQCLGAAQGLLNVADEPNKAKVDTATALFALRTVGSVSRAAASLVDQEFRSLDRASPEWTRLQIARAELADRQGRIDDIDTILADLRAGLIDGGARASLRIEAALAGLAVKSRAWSPRRAEYLEALVDDLRDVVPSARLALLTTLRRCPAVADTAEVAASLRELTLEGFQAEGLRAGADEHDRTWQELTLAHVFRVIGDEEGYRKYRGDAWWKLKEVDLYIGWKLLATDAMFGARQRLDLDPTHFKQFYGEYPMLTARFITEWVNQYGSADTSDRWLAEAESKLSEVQGMSSACGARLREIQAKQAFESGMTDKAETLADQANSIWQSLGDPRRISPNGNPGDPGLAEVALPNAEYELCVTAAHGGNDITIRPRLGQAGSKGFTVSADDFATTSEWIDEAQWGGEALPEWSRRAGATLKAGLLPLLPRGRTSHRLDVNVAFSSPKLAAFPWELAEVDGLPLSVHNSVRYLARSVEGAYQGRREVLYQQHLLTALNYKVGDPDGIPGDLYKSGISRLKDDFGKRGVTSLEEIWQLARARVRRQNRRLNVLVVQPEVGGNLDTLRRFWERTQRLERSYRVAFSEESEQPISLAYRDVAGGEVARLLWAGGEQRQVDVLHICTIMEATEQLPVLGLDASQGPPLDAAEVDQMIARMPNKVPPLVILDVKAPPSPVDARRQLLMRNRFAYQLLALGNVDSIIATGLEARGDAARHWQAIASGLARGLNAAEIWEKIQRLALAEPSGPGARAWNGEAIACTSTALFTAVHPDVLGEPGLM